MKRALLFLVSLLLSAVAYAAVSIPEGAVYIMYTQDDSGGMNMRCTATAYDKKDGKTWFVTAAHCVCKTGSKPGELELTRESVYLSSDDATTKTFVRAKIETVGKLMEGYDFCILSADFPNSALIPLGDESKERAGVEILNIAAPAGLGRVTFHGNVALLKIERPLIDEEQHINWQGGMLVQIPAAGGSSGSSIVSMDTGKVIGILVGTYSQLTIAVPISRAINTDKKFLMPSSPGVSAPDTAGAPAAAKVVGPVTQSQ